MSKSKSSPRVFSREFKLTVVRRMLAGENVSALARELKVLRKDLYAWRDRFRSGGPEALRGRGRPRKAETAVRGKRGKSGGGMNLRFPRRHESDSFWECCCPQTLAAFHLPI